MRTGRSKPSETPTAKQRRVWDKSAPRYDRQIEFFERLLLDGGRAWLGERAVGRVLEVAVGTGRNLPHSANDVVLTGVDLSSGMLQRARARAEELGREVELLEGDASNLPVRDGTCDTVVCALSLCTIPDPAAALAEMHRVLVPGGRLLLIDHVASTWPPVYAVQWLVERITIRTEGEHYTRRPFALVEAAGFTIAESHRTKAGTVERIYATKTR
jgi:ubiquinone/menaquinone biosynthesis C-methylase UbiE